MASPELAVLHTVVSRLDEAAIPYMLSGSTALGAYAVPRMTRDLDVVVDVEPGEAPTLVRAFARGFYCDADAVHRAVTARGMVNVIHLEHVIKVDLIVRKDTAYRRLEFERRRRTRVDDQDMWIVSPEDLVLSKLVWAKESGSAVQVADVKSLIASVSEGFSDTSPEIEGVYRRLLRAKSPSDRVVMACGMLDIARATVLASLDQPHDEIAKRVHLFTRMYERDFDVETAGRIIARLRGGPET